MQYRYYSFFRCFMNLFKPLLEIATRVRYIMVYGTYIYVLGYRELKVKIFLSFIISRKISTYIRNASLRNEQRSKSGRVRIMWMNCGGFLNALVVVIVKQKYIKTPETSNVSMKRNFNTSYLLSFYVTPFFKLLKRIYIQIGSSVT